MSDFLVKSRFISSIVKFYLSSENKLIPIDEQVKLLNGKAYSFKSFIFDFENLSRTS